MVCDGLRWSAMVCDGLRWSAMVCDGLRCSYRPKIAGKYPVLSQRAEGPYDRDGNLCGPIRAGNEHSTG